LVALCLILGITLIVMMSKASSRQQEDAQRIETLSNKWVTVEKEAEDQKSVMATLYKERDEQKKSYEDLTNNFTKISDQLSLTSSNLGKTEADLKSAKDEIAQRDSKIADLEAQNQNLDRQALDLSTALTNLNAQIDETKRKLDASEGDNAFLTKELKRLMAEKAELERQFSDLTVMRAQVAKLKEELSIARRLEWIREGLFARADQHGAQQLMQFGPPPAAAKPPKPAYDLNVEVSADGSVKVIPPLTNTAATSPPAK
jgi:chromosome segregation ATPase